VITFPVPCSWDERRSPRHLRDRGVDVEFATLIFDGPTLEHDNPRRDYGDRRVVGIGIARGVALTVVYTDRTEAGGAVYRRHLCGVLPVVALAGRFGINRRTADKGIDHREETNPAAFMVPSRRLRRATPGGCSFRAGVGHPPATRWHRAARPDLQGTSH